jgi:hypothetical protein
MRWDWAQHSVCLEATPADVPNKPCSRPPYVTCLLITRTRSVMSFLRLAQMGAANESVAQGNSSQFNSLGFYLWFGTRRSKVQITSPRPFYLDYTATDSSSFVPKICPALSIYRLLLVDKKYKTMICLDSTLLPPLNVVEQLLAVATHIIRWQYPCAIV